MAINIANFFVIFVEDDVLSILVEFESDRISPRESGKNGRNGAHGLNCKILVNSEVIFEIHDENYLMKKNFHVSPTILKFSSPNLAGPYLSRAKNRLVPTLKDGVAK